MGHLDGQKVPAQRDDLNRRQQSEQSESARNKFGSQAVEIWECTKPTPAKPSIEKNPDGSYTKREGGSEQTCKKVGEGGGKQGSGKPEAEGDDFGTPPKQREPWDRQPSIDDPNRGPKPEDGALYKSDRNSAGNPKSQEGAIDFSKAPNIYA